MAYTVYIRGIPENKQITEVRVHVTPGLNTPVPFRVPVGQQATCTEIKADPGGDNFQGQVYKWFNLTFSDGRQGWIRNDLLDVIGDWTGMGYGKYDNRTFAFSASAPAPAQPAQSVTPVQSAQTAQPAQSVTPVQSAQTAQPAQSAAPVQPAQASQPVTPTVTVQTSQPAASAQPVVTVQTSQPVAQAQPTVTVQTAQPAVSSQPGATVDIPVTPAPTVTINIPSSGQAASAATGDGTIRSDVRAKVRSAPSISANMVGALDPNTAITVLGAEQGQDGQPYRWAKMTANGLNGYVREDLINFSANCAQFGFGASSQQSQQSTAAPVQTVTPVTTSTTLNTQTKFSSPIKMSYIVFQEYGDTRFGSAHKGADLSRDVGAPVFASGNGVVAYIMRCTKCRDDAPNFQSQGMGFWDAQGIRDPAWGYGFGNHVVVRYAWADLPSAMRDAMTQQGLANGYAYVIHAHLSRIDVNTGDAVHDGTQLGLSGNTGNSSGPHLHLEVRLSTSANENNIFNRVTINPRSMYDF